MQGVVRALAAAVGAFLLVLLGFPVGLGAMAESSGESAPVYVYAGHHHNSAPTSVAVERGPPSTTYADIAHNTDGPGPRGASARSDSVVGSDYTTYGEPNSSTQVTVERTATTAAAVPALGISALSGPAGVAAKSGGALVKYDAGFAIGQLTKGGRGTASGLVDLAESQGWKALQSSSGPLKYFDSNGIERLVIKRGSARTPGSDLPHVAIRNASGQRVDPYGNLVSRNSPGNHTPITWDLP